MSADWIPAQALAHRYKLVLPARPLRGGAGDVLAAGVGASVEFQDFRPYVPGDDPRYIDWAAVARTDQLILRLHRQEVRLALDILLDASRSMELGTGEPPVAAGEPPVAAKGDRAAQTACLLILLGRRIGARTTVWALGEEAIPLREDLESRLGDVRFEARSSLADLLDRNPPRLETGSLRFVLSDFLFPHDPLRLQAFLARGAGGGALLQFLGREEREPLEEGPVRLSDVETGEERELAATAVTVAHYRNRLRMLQEGLSTACRAAGLIWASLPAEASLDALCRGPLLDAGVIEPA